METLNDALIQAALKEYGIAAVAGPRHNQPGSTVPENRWAWVGAMIWLGALPSSTGCFSKSQG